MELLIKSMLLKKFKFNHLFIYGIFFGTFFVFSNSLAKTKQTLLIEEIKFISPNKTLNKSLTQQTHQYKKNTLTKNQLSKIQQTIENYLISNNYRNSEVKKPTTLKKNGKATLSYEIKHPYQYQFIITGNKKVHKLNLYQILKLNNLYHQSNFVDVILNKIKTYYKSLFFNNVQIRSKIIKDSKNYINTIKIKIKEGEQFIIKRITISDISTFNKNFYTKLFRKYASPNLKKSYFNKKDFNQTMNKIITHLRQMGYYYAQIHDVHIDLKKNNVFIQVLIKEGQPITIHRIQIRGQKYFTKKKIIQTLDLKNGSTINILKLDEGLNNLTDLYHEEGFFNFKIKNRDKMVQIKNQSQSASIVIHIQEGKRFYAKNIQVRGNKKIKNSLIIHASSLKEGELINRKKLNKAYDMISDLGLFSSVYVHPSSIIDVKEQKFRFIRLRGGISSENKFSTRLSFDGGIKRFLGDDKSQIAFDTEIKSNIRLLNHLKKIQATFPKDYIEYRILGNYKRHYLFNSRFNGQSSYSFSKAIFSFPEINETSSELKKNQNTESQNIKWTQSQKINFNLERKFDLNTIFNIKILEMELTKSYTLPQENVLSHPSSSSQNIKIKNRWVNTTGVSVFFDRRDDVFFPKKGYQFSSSLNYATPAIGTDPDVHFLKTEAKQKFYIPLIGKKVILAQSFSGGFIHLMPSSGIPYKYLFILGGPNTIRGLDGRSDGERVPSKYDLPIADPNEIIYHSSTFYLIKSEIRFPLYRDSIGGAIFYDGGAVYMKNLKFKNPYQHSIGFSLHFLSPLGPFVVNIAFNPNDLLKDIKSTIKNKDIKYSTDLKIDYSMGAF